MRDDFAADPPAAAARVRVMEVRHVFAGGVAALDGIDLDVPPGQFLAVLGPSGCGKSTLLRLIAGLDRPTAGTITIDHDGANLQPKVQAAASESWRDEMGAAPARSSADVPGQRRAAVACVFQDAHLLPWRTVLNNTALPLELMQVGTRERFATAAETLERVGLAEFGDLYPAQLSGGMRMRASLARALVTHPRLLLLDEPFAALDEITRQRLDEQLRALWAARGMTVIFITHSTTEAIFLAQRTVVLSRRPGRIVDDRKVELPPARGGSLRATEAFAQQTRFVYEALERAERRP